ncbi:MAG: imidazoleglycerol-phosphate dehydratase/histidinol-phosphatase [Luteibaculaceae bacterium]|jgi:imidazoleglycerol-phosphate dehydratase/histidinol-phosphatase
MQPERILFLDRDGTLIVEPQETYQVNTLDEFELIPGVIPALLELKSRGFKFVMVTNQDGLGGEGHPEAVFWTYQNLLLDIFRSQGIVFDDVIIDITFAKEGKSTRKPGLGLMGKYLGNPHYDLSNSWVIGDRLTDVQFAKNMGALSVLFQPEGAFEGEYEKEEETSKEATFTSGDWGAIAHKIGMADREVSISRNTHETQITCKVNLESYAFSSIDTGLPFLDHMIDQIAKHADVGIQLKANGDLHIDEHHTMEDVAIVLGQAFAQGVWKKIGIQRFGFSLPMDDAHCTVRIDFSNRPYFVWEVALNREMVGNIPSEMYEHFFRSFADESRVNLQISATGKNDHHIIESVFKGFGRAVRSAKLRLENDLSLPSTKGML